MNINTIAHEAGRAQERAEALAARWDRPQLIELCALIVGLQSLADTANQMAVQAGCPEAIGPMTLAAREVAHRALGLAGIDTSDRSMIPLCTDLADTAKAILTDFMKD